jgi:hypothetical protein
MDPDATTLQESSGTRSIDAAKTMPEKSVASESVRTAATGSPTENEIARVAYQLWQDSSCPIGSDHENWFRAEAMLKSALIPNCEELSISSSDIVPESEVLCQFRWRGHPEVWEMEWEGPRWVWD